MKSLSKAATITLFLAASQTDRHSGAGLVNGISMRNVM